MSTKLPNLSSAGKTWRQQCDNFIVYYKILSEREKGAEWLLGLFMATQWRRLLNETSPDLDELRLLADALNAERHRQGTAWCDLHLRVSRWIDELERAKENC